MDILLIFACFYFAFSQAKALIDYGNQPWELVHYLLLLLTIVLAGLGVFRSYLYYKDWKYKKEHPEENALPQGAADTAEDAEEDAEGSGEEESDAEEDAAESAPADAAQEPKD